MMDTRWRFKGQCMSGVCGDQGMACLQQAAGNPQHSLESSEAPIVMLLW